MERLFVVPSKQFALEDIFSVHATVQQAYNNDTPIEPTGGSGTLYMHSPSKKTLGTRFIATGPQTLLARCVGSPTELEDAVSTNASSSNIELPSGTRVWNVPVVASATPGWIVTQMGTKGSVGTVKALTNLPA